MEELDDIQRVKNANTMIENIVQTLGNVSSDASLHSELINNGLIEVIQKFVLLFAAQCQTHNVHGVNEELEGINLLKTMPTSALKMIKCIVEIIHNLSLNPAVESKCVKLGIIPIMKTCLVLHDYKLFGNLFDAMGRYLISEDPEIRRKMVYSGILQVFLENHEKSKYSRIIRISAEYLTRVSAQDPQLFQLNDRVEASIQQANSKQGGGLPPAL